MKSRRIKPYVAVLAMLAALSVAAGSTQAAMRGPSASPLPIQSGLAARAPIAPVDVAAEMLSRGSRGWAILKAFMDRLRAGYFVNSAPGIEERDPAGTPDPLI